MRQTRMVVLISVLAAAAFILMVTVQVPVLPAAPYLRYDSSEVVGLLMAFATGLLAWAEVSAGRCAPAACASWRRRSRSWSLSGIPATFLVPRASIMSWGSKTLPT